MADKQRVVIVSNRLPVSLKRVGDNWQSRKTAGGLASAMQPILEGRNGIWIGWSGDASDNNDEKRRKVLNDWAKQDRYFAVDLAPVMLEDSMRGFQPGIGPLHGTKA